MLKKLYNAAFVIAACTAVAACFYLIASRVFQFNMSLGLFASLTLVSLVSMAILIAGVLINAASGGLDMSK